MCGSEKKIYIVGMGPGREDMMTGQALAVLDRADLIVGYTAYIRLLGDRFAGKETFSTPMRQEQDRCRYCFAQAREGRRVALICSGDAGVYGLASLMLEIGEDYPDVELEIVPGITAAVSGAALLGAPINHDFCVISLSDQLTDAAVIERRLRAVAEGDFVIVLYNPQSRTRRGYLKKACQIIEQTVGPDRACGWTRCIGREGTQTGTCTLRELQDVPADMFTTVFIGNASTFIAGGRLVTRRGYHV